MMTEKTDEAMTGGKAVMMTEKADEAMTGGRL